MKSDIFGKEVAEFWKENLTYNATVFRWNVYVYFYATQLQLYETSNLTMTSVVYGSVRAAIWRVKLSLVVI
jgi:hypothetical protein